MADYSSQKPEGRKCAHAEHIDIEKFTAFLQAARGIDLDIMLEIKDKEKSAVRALAEIIKKRGFYKHKTSVP